MSEKLISALRRCRNNNDDNFVAVYDRETTDRVFKQIIDENTRLIHRDRTLDKITEIANRQRLGMFIQIMKFITNGEWDEIKKVDPELHDFIRRAVNRGHNE